MATLSSTSTDAEVFAAYDDNASYAEDGSQVKAKAFVTACLILMRRRPNFAGMVGGQQVTFDSLRDDMLRAEAWLDAHPASSDLSSQPRERYFSMENFRG